MRMMSTPSHGSAENTSLSLAFLRRVTFTVNTFIGPSLLDEVFLEPPPHNSLFCSRLISRHSRNFYLLYFQHSGSCNLFLSHAFPYDRLNTL